MQKIKIEIMKPFLLTLSVLAWATIAIGQQKITIEDIYSKPTFRQESVYGVNWMNNGQYYSAQENNDIVKYDVATGAAVATILKGSSLSPAIKFVSYRFSKDEKQVLLMTQREKIYRRSYKAEFYVYHLADKTLKKLSQKGKQSYATFSPDGSKIAFVRNNDLFYVNLADMSETQVTNDGRFNHIINGSTDWVYEEEFSFTKAFYWSPDNQKIAYIRFDESDVKEYNMQVWQTGKLYPKDYLFKYPKAGEDNAKVSVLIYNLANKKKTKADIGNEVDIYIPRVQWTKDANLLSVRKMNRLQNQLEIYHVNGVDGTASKVLTETSETYIDLDYCDDLTYLKDGKHFIHSSEKSGNKHLYLYTVTGKLVRQITNGNWEVTQFMGIDESSKRKALYYISTEGSPLERYFYVTDLNGKGKIKLSQNKGTNSVNLSKDYKYYLAYHHSAQKPLSVDLYKTKGNKLIKNLKDNAKLASTASTYQLHSKEFFTFKTVDNTALNGYFLKPSNFDATKKYPVLIYQYSGPGSQQVTNSWGGRNYFWHQMLTQKGYIIAVIDTRGTGARGEKFKKATYKQLGKLEVEDHIAGAKYLGSLPYIDAGRIGIWGWSFGGYVSSLAMMQGAGIFKAGIAVAPVTNWRFYDTVYTERYLQRPADNPVGYDDNSPTTHAAKLQGNFLLIHGTGDDNVHFQNSVTLQEALIAKNKQFQSFYYPNKAHGISGSQTRIHLFNMITKFVTENL